jgi:arylsulfatase A-like enzyme
MTDGGKRIEVPTSHIDIVPTILDLLGVEIDPKVQGRSLVPLILRDGPWTPRVVSLEYGRSYSLRARDWRFIVEYDGAESLYNLAADPTEQREVSKSQPVALRYLRDIAGFFLEHRSQWSVPRWGDLANHSPAFAARAAEH